MDVELLQSHDALPLSAALEVAVLLKLTPAVFPTTAKAAALHVGMCLDVSGSMAAKSVVSGLNKLEALKASVQGALQLLEGCAATVTVSAFSDGETQLALGEALRVGNGAAPTLCSMVEGLGIGGGTEAVTAMEPVLEALMKDTRGARRLLLVTDGEFNTASVKKCQKLATTAGEHGVALWVFATGVTYNEAYLRDLVARGAPGGLFCHVTDLTTLHNTLTEEITAVTQSNTHQVKVTLQVGPQCTLMDVSRLTPTQAALPLRNGSASDGLDVLDARGQAYVARVQAHALPLGVHDVLHAVVTWKDAQGAHHKALDARTRRWNCAYSRAATASPSTPL